MSSVEEKELKGGHPPAGKNYIFNGQKRVGSWTYGAEQVPRYSVEFKMAAVKFQASQKS